MQSVGKFSETLLVRRGSQPATKLALMAIHDELVNAKPDILAANKIDMDNGHKNELDSALLDRLELNEARFNAMLQGLKAWRACLIQSAK